MGGPAFNNSRSQGQDNQAEQSFKANKVPQTTADLMAASATNTNIVRRDVPREPPK